MRYERLVIEAGTNTFTLDLDPRLTVIAGVGRLEREALAAELLGALTAARAGVHVEAVEDTGRRLAVFRPTGARGRVVDVDRVHDVTNEFTETDGRISLVANRGLDAAGIRRKLRFGAADLQAASQGSALIRRLATVDQSELWSAAERLLVAEQELQSEADELGSAPEDAAVIERVEERHRRFEAAQARHNHLRRIALTIAGAATVAAAAAAATVGDAVAIGMLFVACVSMLLSVATRSRAESAHKAEAEALAEAGAQSYLGFHLQRVNGMLSSEQARKRLLSAAERNRAAEAGWRALAGDIPVAWAVDHHEEIAGAARVRIDISTHANMSVEGGEVGEDTTDLARVLVGRLAELRHLGGGTESYPMILDDPFADLERSSKPALLELISHTSGSPQLVYLTEDEDVASWARLEALTGALSIIEPAAEPARRSHGRLRSLT